MRAAAGFFLALLLIASPVRADGPAIVDAPTAQARAASGEITLIDVRSPAEWRKTGVPHGAMPVTIHHRAGIRGFVAETDRALGGNKDRPVALICATGRRSAVAAEALRRAGFTNVLNIREGMLGNRADGPGWLGRKLPVDDCKSC
jgi:rhodanese-related sulfurtransferase